MLSLRLTNTPWNQMKLWRYSDIDSESHHYVETNGQFHAPADSPLARIG
jgi:hypothetical protein